MYHGSKSESHQWGSWSAWVFNKEQSRYYRFRQDSEGNYDFDWDQHDSAATAHAQTPRDTTISDITEGLRGLTTDYNGSKNFAVSEDHASKPRSSKHRSKHKQRTGSRDEDSAQDAYGTFAADSLHASQAGQYDYTAGQYVHGSSEAQYYQASTSDSQSAAAYGSGRAEGRSAENHAVDQQTHRYSDEGHYSPDQEPEDEELADTIAASRQYNYDEYANAGESSAAAYAPYDEEEEEGPPTPRAQSSAGSYHIAATVLEEPPEELDPRYQVEPSIRFQPGEIFKVHWSEPQGASSDGAPSVSGKHEIQNRFGTKFFVGFRRFIVIANDQGHCTCVPILTYGGKGCKKKGVKADKHGIIYERGGKPRLLDKEPKLGFPPVRVEMKQEGEKLSKESRVNYSKLVTVEHNVKVFFIGSIVYNDWELVSDAVNHCWNKKNHQKQRHR
ncbi:uncharacterized protein TrAFT101_009155 [Trichoderma asperellum]|uniref:uncharacterized protein n=1 Tax=Trichoderma asperellum TaxID=101201 RepID=UPI0033320FDE|nr:hypothetical protein TrAFT101_009155 [Trichoderma asperellum]